MDDGVLHVWICNYAASDIAKREQEYAVLVHAVNLSSILLVLRSDDTKDVVNVGSITITSKCITKAGREE